MCVCYCVETYGLHLYMVDDIELPGSYEFRTSFWQWYGLNFRDFGITILNDEWLDYQD